MRKFGLLVLKILFSFTLVVALLEAALRIEPRVIPLPLLVQFPDDLRHEIARRVRLPAEGVTVLIDRDDNGPPLRKYQPSAVVDLPFDREDHVDVTSVQMDENGFCNPPAAAALQYVDVVMIGDSFTTCIGIHPEDSWWARFSKISGRSAYGIGIGGTGPYEALQSLKQFGLSTSPGTVVLNIYAGNDFHNALGVHEYRETLASRGGRKDLVYDCVGLPSFACVLYRGVKEGIIGRSSYVFGLASTFTRTFTRDSILWVRSLRGSDQEQKMNYRYRVHVGDGDIVFNRGNSDVSDLDRARSLKDGNVSLDQGFGEALKTFTALARQHHFRPVVALTPAAYDVYGERVRFEDPVSQTLIYWFTHMERQYFSDSANELGYTFVDFTPALQEASTGKDLLYFPVNGHYSRAGHAVVAQALLEGLTPE